MVAKKNSHKYVDTNKNSTCGMCVKFMKCFKESNEMLGLGSNNINDDDIAQCISTPSCKEYEEVE